MLYSPQLLKVRAKTPVLAWLGANLFLPPPQITFPWAEQQVQNAQSILKSITILQSLASQSPLGEITLNLVSVPSPTSEVVTCGTL